MVTLIINIILAIMTGILAFTEQSIWWGVACGCWIISSILKLVKLLS